MRLLIAALMLISVSAFGQSSLPPCLNDTSAYRNNCFGTHTDPNGVRYTGEWRDGLPHGQGIAYAANGSILRSGRWENGQLNKPYALNTSKFPFDAEAERRRADSERLAREAGERKAADIVFPHWNSCWRAGAFHGAIQKGDDQRLEKIILEFHRNYHNVTNPDACLGGNITLHLNSRGGNVLAALALGRIIRKYELKVTVNHVHECASSCVLVMAAGVERLVIGGRVAVHTPFFEKLDPQMTISDIGQARRNLNSLITKYLAEMNVSERLLEVMLSAPPETFRVLTDREMSDLRLTGEDPDHQEKYIASRAYEYGITSADYRERQKIWRANYRNTREIDQEAFRTSVILQISLEKAKEVNDRIYTRCIDPIQDGITPQKQIIECVRAENLAGSRAVVKREESPTYRFVPLNPK